jgi:hypothetical protein
MGFVNVPTSLHKWLAVETCLADREFLQVAVNGEEFKKLQGKTCVLVISQRDWEQFKPE